MRRLAMGGTQFNAGRAVLTTREIRRDLDLRWRSPLRCARAQTGKCHRDRGLADRTVDCSSEERVLAEPDG